MAASVLTLFQNPLESFRRARWAPRIWASAGLSGEGANWPVGGAKRLRSKCGRSRRKCGPLQSWRTATDLPQALPFRSKCEAARGFTGDYRCVSREGRMMGGQAPPEAETVRPSSGLLWRLDQGKA